MEALQIQINNLQKQLNDLTHEERLRDVVFFNNDVSSATFNTHTVSFGAGGGTDSFSLPKTPDIYLRIYFRGKVYNIPAYNIT